MPRDHEITFQETSRDLGVIYPWGTVQKIMALPGIERADPKHLKEDLLDQNFHKKKSGYIRTFLLQITLSWKQNSNIAINYEQWSHLNAGYLIKETVSV